MFTVSESALFSSGNILFTVNLVDDTRRWLDVSYDPSERTFQAVGRHQADTRRWERPKAGSCTSLASDIVALIGSDDPVADAATLAGQVFASIKPVHDDWRQRKAETEAFLSSPMGLAIKAKRDALRGGNEILPSDNV